MKNLSSKNQEGISFIGAGAYDKYVPTIVDFYLQGQNFILHTLHIKQKLARNLTIFV